MMNDTELKQILIQEAKEIESYVIKTRRYVHQHPETAFEEIKTQDFIEAELKNIGYETIRVARTGVVGILNGENPGQTIALRADTDALNLTEENDVEYASKFPGKMHACGHDAHTAMLLGAAKLIFKHRADLSGTLKLFFQPAEEGGGGGKLICDEGHLDNVDRIFGIHVWRELEAGLIGLRKGGMLASADAFTVIITGKGGHAAAPHQAIDPTAVLVDIYNALQKIVSREIDPFCDVIMTTPVMQGSDAFNVIPGEAKLMIFNEGDMIPYPPLINDAQTIDEISRILEGTKLKYVSMDPSMGGEDFAFYLQKTKGAFLTLGIYNEEKGITSPHHHPQFDVDEAVLWKGTALYSILAFYQFFKV
ncbi:MAG: M20 metallopeptidase family protein [Candidatus Hodarchaeales archaeon]|jgi:metal-dependent amidase/aminoacylase/carboxypeptidase family protein